MQLRAIAGCVKLGYFFFPHFGLICLWLLSALSSADHSVSQSPWKVHTTLTTPFGTWAGFQVCMPRQEVEFFLSLPSLISIPSLAPASSHDWSCTVLLSFRLIWHLYIMFKTGGCLSWSFLLSWWQIPEATGPAQPRKQLDCRQLTHGQDKAPSVSLQTWFTGQSTAKYTWKKWHRTYGSS